MVVARGDQRKARPDEVAGRSFLDVHAAEAVEALGKCEREACRDVLRDDHTGHIGRKMQKNILNRDRASRGGSDGDQRSGMGRDAARRRQRSFRRGNVRLDPQTRSVGRANLAREDVAQIADRVRPGRLREDIDRSVAQRLERR